MSTPATIYCNSCGAAMSASDASCPGCKRPQGVSPAPYSSTTTVARRDDRVRRHVGTVAILYYVVGILQSVGAIALFVVATVASRSVELEGPEVLGPFVLRIVGLCVAGLAALFLSVGWGLQHRRLWARTAALILGFLALINVPFGTALGIYTLWVLLPAESGEQYRKLAEPA